MASRGRWWLLGTREGRNLLRKWVSRTVGGAVLLLAVGCAVYMLVLFLQLGARMQDRSVDLATISRLTGVRFPEGTVLTRSVYGDYFHPSLKAEMRLAVWKLTAFKNQEVFAANGWEAGDRQAWGKDLPAGCREVETAYFDAPRVKLDRWSQVLVMVGVAVGVKDGEAFVSVWGAGN